MVVPEQKAGIVVLIHMDEQDSSKLGTDLMKILMTPGANR
jgi:hypothetical protein